MDFKHLFDFKKINFSTFFTSTLNLKNLNYNLLIPTLNLFSKNNYYLKFNYFIKLVRLINLTKNLNFLQNLTIFFKIHICKTTIFFKNLNLEMANQTFQNSFFSCIKLKF